RKYLETILHDEMPAGLKKYMEVELFPRIHLWPGKRGISITTCCHFLHAKGFNYVETAKGVYYDGHERSDVIEYCQDSFISALHEERPRMIQYKVGNVDEELEAPEHNYVEWHVVLVFQDEMTYQAKDGKKKAWAMDGKQPLKKKRQGRGLHHSNVICSMFGWMKDAGQVLEYGKNYNGYWNGELC
ncbi:hypothetical protein FISHEDRAFT_37142, partial [Fistulina hepatica ATCC 64428]